MAEKLEDLNLPNAVVARIIKQAISDNVFVGKEARIALGRAASVFVLYVTAAATNVAKKGSRKTVTGQDVLEALSELEFDEFIEPLKEHLEAFKKGKKDSAAKGKQKKTNETEQEQEIEEIEMIEDDETL